MLTLTKLVWKEIIRGQKWQTASPDRFYKILYHAKKDDGRATADHDHFSLYLSYPQGMDHYIRSMRDLDALKALAQEHANNQK